MTKVNGNVGIVIVSHSIDVARGTADMVRQMVGNDVPLGFCGGNPDGGLGTSVEKILAAIDAAWSEDGVAILVDLGGAEAEDQVAFGQGVEVAVAAHRNAHRVKPVRLEQALELGHILRHTHGHKPTCALEKFTQHEQTQAVLSTRLGQQEQAPRLALRGGFLQKLAAEVVQQLLQMGRRDGGHGEIKPVGAPPITQQAGTRRDALYIDVF